MQKIRKPAVAGTFYPGDKESLQEMIEESFNAAKDIEIKGELRALIVPHAGYIYSGIVAAEGFKLLKKRNNIKKVLLIGPAHYCSFQGAAAPEVDAWETPLGKVKVKNILDEIGDSNVISPYEEAFREEHSLEVEVPFMQSVLKDWTLYPLCLGDLDTDILAKELKDFAKHDDVMIVVSSDLSHFYTYDEANDLDENANKFIPEMNIKSVLENVEACGKKGILTVLHLSKILGWKGHFIDYKNSGDTAGDKSRVVGYGCYAFTN